jgi:hypothetical protein
MQTITTRFIGPTNTRPARMVATVSGSPYRILEGRDKLPSDDEACHAEMCRRMCRLMGWSHTSMVGGHLKGGAVVWVFDSSSSPRTAPRPVYDGLTLAEAAIAFAALMDQAGPRDIRGARTTLRGISSDMGTSRTLRRHAAILEAALGEMPK